MMNHHKLWLAFLVISLAVLSACNRPEPSLPAMEGVDATRSVLSTPMPDSSTITTPTPEDEPAVLPVSDDVAAIQGRLVLMDPTSIAPAEDGLYLVPVDRQGEEGVSFAVPTIDEETALQAQIDEVTGAFEFTNVPLGLYVLVARTDTGLQVSVRSFSTGDVIMITVEDADLGTVIDLDRVRL